MDNPKTKRFRSINFSNKEKEVLFSLVLQYKNIVENKKTDSVSVQEKMEAWQNITKQFNALSPNLCTRNTESLKKFYENKKKEVRKQVAEEKKEIFVTGGGTKKDIKMDSSKDLLLSIMNSKTVFGLENCFDSDHIDVEENIEMETEMEVNCDRPEINDTVDYSKENQPAEAEFVINALDIPSIQSQWKKASALKSPLSENLKRPHSSNDLCDRSTTTTSDMASKTKTDVLNKSQSTPLSSNRRRPKTMVRALSSSNLAEKYEVLLDKRLQIADFERKKLESDIEIQKKEHNLRIELLKIQIEREKKKQMKI